MTSDLALHVDADGFRRHAGQGGDDEELARRLENVDRRLPTGGARAFLRRLEKLALQPLCLVEQRASLRPHQIFGITHWT